MKELNNQDKTQYDNCKKVSDDLIDIINDNKEIKSYDNLQNFIATNRCAKELIDNITNAEYIDKQLKKINSYDTQKAQEKLSNSINRVERRKKAFTIIKKLSISSVAASIIIALFVIYNNNLQTEITATTSYANEPILVLSNGDVIKLNHNKAQQIINDNIVINKNNNELTAKIDDKTALGNNNDSILNTIIIPDKCSYKLNLSDGSTVNINAKGVLKFPSVFDKDKREVELDGEGFFSISKSDIPFIVKVNNVRIRVYGTKFNVKKFYNGVVETVLVEGSVGVSGQIDKEIKIKPNQRIIISENLENGYNVDEVSTDEYLAWIDNNFMFNKSTITKVIEDLENWYNVKFDVDNIRDSNNLEIKDRVDLFVSRDVELSKILLLIENTTKYKFINEGGGKYTVSINTSKQ